MTKKNSQRKKISMHERRRQVAVCHESGANFQQIAEGLAGTGFQVTKEMIEADLQAIYAAQLDGGVEFLRMMRARQNNRFDALIRANWDKALAGDERAGKLVKELMSAQSELLGLKAAAKFEHGGAVPLVQMTLAEWRTEQAKRRAEAAQTSRMFEAGSGDSDDEAGEG